MTTANVGERNAATPHAPDPDLALKALKTVLTFTVTDIFGLVPEEMFWFKYNLTNVCAPLQNKTPHMVPLMVRHELLTGYYANRLDEFERSDRREGDTFDRRTAQATAQEWGTALAQTITASYRLSNFEEAAIQGKIVAMLRELGVSDPVNPRSSRYIPNDVRHLLNYVDVH